MSIVDLARRRILVVEDDLLVASGIVNEIEHHNGIPIGPAPTLVAGTDLLRGERPDACILNIRLGSDMVYPLADEIVAAGIPFVFASAEHPSSIPYRFKDVPLHAKPIDVIKAAVGLLRASTAEFSNGKTGARSPEQAGSLNGVARALH